MAKACSICGKGKIYGSKISFSNRKSNRNWKPNIRKVKANVNGTTRRINVCTNCLKSGRVERAL